MVHLSKKDGCYCTVTVPTRKGCSVQKYLYSPGSVGIATGLLAWFAPMSPESNLPSGVGDSPEVAVWRALS
jgi:hypothetical protein